jgi:hypothetical protein
MNEHFNLLKATFEAFSTSYVLSEDGVICFDESCWRIIAMPHTTLWLCPVIIILVSIQGHLTFGLTPGISKGHSQMFKLPLSSRLFANNEVLGDNDINSTMSMPMVESRKRLFDTLQLPRDSIDRALRSKIEEHELSSFQRMAGLERENPTEIEIRGNDDSENDDSDDIVETVDTFRFTINKADLERAMNARPSGDVKNSREGHGEDATAPDRLMADAAFIQRLEQADYEVKDDGARVLRIEMDMDELESMLGVEASYTEDGHDEEGGDESARGGRRMEEYSSTRMSRAEVSVAAETSSSRGESEERESGSSNDGVESNLLTEEKPMCTVQGFRLSDVLGDSLSSVSVLVAYGGILHILNALARNLLVQSRRRRGTLFGPGRVTVPWLSLSVGLGYVLYHAAQHIREGRRFQGIGHAPPQKSFVRRLFPGLYSL